MKRFSNSIFIVLVLFSAASLFIFSSNNQKDSLCWGFSCILTLLSFGAAFSNSLYNERQVQQNNSKQDALDKIPSVISEKTKRDQELLEKLFEQSSDVHRKMEELFQKQSGEYVNNLEHLKQTVSKKAEGLSVNIPRKLEINGCLPKDISGKNVRSNTRIESVLGTFFFFGKQSFGANLQFLAECVER